MPVSKLEIIVFTLIFLIILFTDASKYGLKEPPNHVKVLIGQPAVLKCRIDIPENVVKVKLQWSKDMFGLENSTIQDVYKGRISIPGHIQSGIYDLYFKTTEHQDEALYACHIELTFRDGENVESIIGKGSLKVIEPPSKLDVKFHIAKGSTEFLWQPGQSTIWGVQNRRLQFSCESEGGNPIPQLVPNIRNDDRQYDIDNYQKIQALDLSSDLHNSNISCTIANKMDYLGVQLPQTKAHIRVLYLDDVVIRKINGNPDEPINNGESVSFVCSSSHTPDANLYYSWYIQYNSPEKVFTEYLVEKSSSNNIVLKASSKYHKSRLYCSLYATVQKDDCNSANKPCAIHLKKDVASPQILNILYPPKIKVPYENITITNMGEWVILSCDVDSNPPASIKWFRTLVGTSKQARSINWYFQTSISNLVDSLTIDNIIYSSSYYKFQVLNEHELDIYICEAKSSNHQKAYKYVIVAKEEEPTIKVDHPILKVENNAKASLMCIIESWPRPLVSTIKWYFEMSDAPLISTERRLVINKRQLMGVESKLYFKSVLSSDYGTYTCTASHGSKTVSKKISLHGVTNKLPVYIAIGASSFFCIVVLLMVIFCVCCRKNTNKRRKNKKAPLQPIMLPSPTIDSSIENEIFINRLNSIPGYQKENGLNEQIILPSNRCFVFQNQPSMSHISKLSCGDSRNGQDEKSTTKGNESNRSWDSGVGPDDTVYRNGQLFQNPRGSNCISPFSTLASSNNSIGPVIPNMTNRYWQQYPAIDLINQQNPDSNSSKLSTTENSNFNGSVHSGFMPSQNENLLSLIGNSPNQSFVCIPIEEYQHHMRILQESQGPPSLRSFSIASYSTNNGNSTFLPNYRAQNGNISPTDVSVKSNSTNSKM